MPRKYTRKAASTASSQQADAFAAILRPVVQSLVTDIFSDFARAWLQQHAEPQQAAPAIIEPAAVQEPKSEAEPAALVTVKRNGKREVNGAAPVSE